MLTEKIFVTLTYDPTKAGGPWFTSTDPTKFPKPGAQTDKIKVKHGKNAEITFTVQTEDINFDANNPIDIRPVDANKPYDLSQFKRKVDGNELKLTDKNVDQEETDYYYQLNFEGKGSLDPIIQNGCCRPAVQADYLTPLAIGAAALLALYFFVVRPRMGRRTAQGKGSASQDKMDH